MPISKHRNFSVNTVYLRLLLITRSHITPTVAILWRVYINIYKPKATYPGVCRFFFLLKLSMFFHFMNIPLCL